MRIRSTIAPLAIPAVVVALMVSGCSSGAGSVSGSGTMGSTNDINSQPVDTLRDGGNLRMWLTTLPSNFNILQVDGNDDSGQAVAGPTMPGTVNSDAAGNLSVDHNYFTDIHMTSTNPQRIVYTINPKAVWSDGAPITWEDLKSEAQAMNGANKAYQVAASVGYDRIATVERGADDRQAVVTYAKPYGDWKGLFSPLYPKAVTATPEAFNTMDKNGLPVSAGPFVVTTIDRTQNRITLTRNPRWWGATPKLDTITMSVLDASAVLGAVQNNEIDWAPLSSLSNVVAAKNTPGVVIRRTPQPSWDVLTFNGAKGALLEDPRLRLAIAKGINRQEVVETSQHGLVNNPAPLNNHVFMAGQKGYRDNSAVAAYNPQEAAKELDALGWKLNGDVREKDGRKLELRDVMYSQQEWVAIAKVIQQDLAKIGVKLDIQQVPGQGLFTDVLFPGNFDLAQTGWGGSSTPISSLDQIYSYRPDSMQGNFGRIGSPALNDEIDQTIAELDPAKAIQMANDCDTKIWGEGFSLPLMQSPGNYAVRANLANIGAFGLADTDWTKVGFLK